MFFRILDINVICTPTTFCKINNTKRICEQISANKFSASWEISMYKCSFLQAGTFDIACLADSPTKTRNFKIENKLQQFYHLAYLFKSHTSRIILSNCCLLGIPTIHLPEIKRENIASMYQDFLSQSLLVLQTTALSISARGLGWIAPSYLLSFSIVVRTLVDSVQIYCGFYFTYF